MVWSAGALLGEQILFWSLKDEKKVHVHERTSFSEQDAHGQTEKCTSYLNNLVLKLARNNSLALHCARSNAWPSPSCQIPSELNSDRMLSVSSPAPIELCCRHTTNTTERGFILRLILALDSKKHKLNRSSRISSLTTWIPAEKMSHEVLNMRLHKRL